MIRRFRTKGSLLKFLRYEHGNTEVAREVENKFNREMREVIAFKFKMWLKKRWKQIGLL